MRIHDNNVFEQFYRDLEQSLHLFEELECSLDALHVVAAQSSPPVTTRPGGIPAARQS
jgi:RNAse (barnase) inhibitor barstar